MTEPKHARALLEKMFHAAVAAAQPDICVPPYLPKPPRGKLVVIGAGKASAAMAAAVEAHWPGSISGIVVTRYGYAVPCRRIEIVEAAHPVPDAAGMHAALRMLEKVSSLTADDLVLCLISGGGSALLPVPAAGLTLEQKQDVNRTLLRAGATISEINTVRRHISGIKGGRLAAACFPAAILNLLISDVPGDDPANIASGPTVADVTTVQDAQKILTKYNVVLPAGVLSESRKPDDPGMSRITTHLVATPAMSLAKAEGIAKAAGVHVYMLGDALEGEARKLGADHASLALRIAEGKDAQMKAPCILLSGGETTVTVTGNGQGGRNVEYALSLAIGLGAHPRIHALAADTDGVDGMVDIAGAFVAPDTLTRAKAKGMVAREFLGNNDGHGFFGKLGDSLVTGPTCTNVNDFRAIFIL